MVICKRAVLDKGKCPNHLCFHFRPHEKVRTWVDGILISTCGVLCHDHVNGYCIEHVKVIKKEAKEKRYKDNMIKHDGNMMKVYSEGYDKGYCEGYDKGYETGREDR